MVVSALVIDDEPEMCEMLAMALADIDVQARTATSSQDALDLLAHEEFNVVLTDVSMPVMDGLQLCSRVAQVQPGVPVVVVTGRSDLDTAIGAMRAGAYDFLVKPVDLELLSLVVARAVQHGRLRAEVKRLRAVVDATTGAPDMVGASAAMRKVHETIARILDSDATVVVSGETGTGKEMVGPFVSINCAAVPQSLLESELFGHVRGAFTDAKAPRMGLFVEADGGTLFLDEIAEMPLEMQAKLLRSLQERRVRPVGSNDEVAFDARIIAATNRDLDEEVYEKRFREDLYYRINVVRIDLPPLRERAGDVLDLAQYFLAQHAARTGRSMLGVSVPAAEKLVAYRWPGNVRELQNCIERAVAFARFEAITVDDLPEKIRDYQTERFAVEANDSTEIVTLDELERRYVQRALSLLGGNKSRAAELLGIDRRTLYRRIDRWGSRS
jgi:DNA-binding NtrC family response regulator